VEIKERAREVGGRTKIAVWSRDESIDPVGACVGLKGSRVQAVVSELGGERIDIVPWSNDTETFARRALAPARVSRVIPDSARQVITAIVDEDQLSLAIGRNGQNVRLASQLIGWQIDLYGSREWLEKGVGTAIFGDAPVDDGLETSDFPLSELAMAPETLAALEGAGYRTFLDIIDLERADFVKVEGFSNEGVDEILRIIDELTVVEGEEEEGLEDEGLEATAEAADAEQGEGGEEDKASHADTDEVERATDEATRS
jgi:N utilization substance protein A